MTKGRLGISSLDISEGDFRKNMQGCRNIDDFKSFFVVEKILHLFEFEKWRTIRASVGGVGSVLAWVAY